MWNLKNWVYISLAQKPYEKGALCNAKVPSFDLCHTKLEEWSYQAAISDSCPTQGRSRLASRKVDIFIPDQYGPLYCTDFHWKNKNTLKIRMIQASLNRGSRLGAKTSVQGKPWTKAWYWKFYKCFSKIGGNFSFLKMLNFLSFLVLLYVSGHSKQKFFF